MTIFLLILGISGGLLISAGLFAFLISVGVMKRLIGKTRLFNHIKLFEITAVLGVTLGNLINIYMLEPAAILPFSLANIVMLMFGVFTGIFVGILIMSLAETLDSMPVFAHNMHIIHGFKYIIVAIAAGKFAGAVLQFMMNMK